VIQFALPRLRSIGATEVIPVGRILRIPGLLWIIIASSLCVTAGDLLLVYLPVLGAERALDAATIGWLLSLRAAVAMTSRLFFSRLIRVFGRMTLMMIAMVSGALAIGSLAMPLPVWGLAISMAVTGFGLGIALTATLSLTVVAAPATARATAISLRLTANRVGQFLIPLGSGLIAGALGVGSVFALMAASLVGSCIMARVKGRDI
jgi:predicted MFS family arabinose efflux permease